ncbi:MAG: cellulase family glycosylhydrolase [Candidatus Lernaella stagnicola]|nr:cellulase family glycosylhydrolase [Candidatus Lernaella stagnicola]
MKWAWLLIVLSFIVPLAACSGGGDDANGDAGSDDDDDDDDDDNDDDDNDDDDNDNNDDDDDNNNDDNDNDDNDNNDDDNDTVTPTPIPQVTDELEREVIIHGTNYMGLEFGWYNQTPEDFEQIAAWGFTHVRLPISWRFMEPEEGVWDPSYLTEKVEPVLDMIHAAGLKAVPDMHQWQWCRRFGGNGAPDWACPDEMYPEGYVGMLIFAADFWDRGLDRHWRDAWELTWDYLADHPAVWGWDLFNEPWAGVRGLLPSFERHTLADFYQELYDLLRTYDEEAWVFLEPNIFAALLPSYLPPITGERLIFSPHLYTGLTSLDGIGYWFPESYFDFDMRKADGDRARTGYPLVTGEFGVTKGAPDNIRWLRDAVGYHDEYMFGEIVWCYWKSDGGWSLLNADGSEYTPYTDLLLRPYPRAVPGHIEAFGFDFDTGVFELTYRESDTTSDELLVFVPERHFPDGFTVTSSDPLGTWTQSYDPQTQVLTIVHDPDMATHTITVTP